MTFTSLTHICCREYAAADAQVDKVVALAEEKGAVFWKACGMVLQGCVLALSGRASNAFHVLTSGLTAFRSTGATAWSRCRYHVWRGPMRNSANSMTLGA